MKRLVIALGVILVLVTSGCGGSKESLKVNFQKQAIDNSQ